jgi:NADH-quinone oxidoreductase subunit N
VSLPELMALLPLIIAGGAALAAMLALAVARHHGLTLALTVGGLAVLLAVLPLVAHHAPIVVTPLLTVDGLSLFYTGLVTLAAMATALLIYGYVEPGKPGREELYLLLVIALLGAIVLVSSRHFAAFFLGLELVSVSLFAMLAYPRRRPQSLEAGIKYLILSSLASAMILFGMALIYVDLGSLGFAEIGERLIRADWGMTGYLLGGTALLVAGVGFKLSLVPFHMWTPDVYQGAPAPVAGFLATVSKGAVLVLLLRYLVETGAYTLTPVLIVLGLISAASMVVGNLLALLQTNIKRILAYSSIAHFGYLLVALLAAGELGIEAVSFYLVAYFVMTLGAFGVVTVCSREVREAEALEDYRGLAWRRPWLSGLFTAMLLSLAGIPLTAGFIAKFYIFAAGVGGALWLLVGILVGTSVVALFYYLRIIVVLFTVPEEGWVPAAGSVAIPPISAAVLTVLAAILFWLGVYPAPLVATLRGIASSLM